MDGLTEDGLICIDMEKNLTFKLKEITVIIHYKLPTPKFRDDYLPYSKRLHLMKVIGAAYEFDLKPR